MLSGNVFSSNQTSKHYLFLGLLRLQLYPFISFLFIFLKIFVNLIFATMPHSAFLYSPNLALNSYSIHLSSIKNTRNTHPLTFVSARFSFFGKQDSHFHYGHGQVRQTIGYGRRSSQAIQAIQEQDQQVASEEILKIEDIHVGDCFEAVVTGVVPFGCFMNIGAERDGLLHISKFSTTFVADLKRLVKIGDVIPVEVIFVNPKKGEISLRKILSKEELAEQALQRRNASSTGGSGQVGQGKPQNRFPSDNKAAKLRAYVEQNPVDMEAVYEGTVVSLTKYGAFVDIGFAVDGLLHQSQLREETFYSISDVVSVGDKVRVKIIEVDTTVGKLSLSMRDI